MRSVALATCAGDDVDVDSPLLLDALRHEGLDAALCVWDDPAVEWARFDLVVVRSTWDYAPRRAEFLAWARRVPRLANPYPVIEYSSDKHYLADLAARGFPTVSSYYCDVGTPARFPDADFVVKPCVGAGSLDAERYGANEVERASAHVARLHDLGRDVLIQPYVASVDDAGERALVFLDGTFSHAMTKAAMLNVTELDRHALYRREQLSLASAESDAIALGEAVLAQAPFASLLYARVDLVAGPKGWLIMELELVEPSLFLSFAPGSPTTFARAIASRLD